jgi:hypothetical protein
MMNLSSRASVETSDVELSILACPYDTKFLRFTVPHLVKSLGCVTALRTLLVDWMPASGFYSTVYPDRQEAEFEAICDELMSGGWIDRVLRIPYDQEFVASFLGKNVQGKFNATHNIRGYPIYGSMLGVLGSKKKYLVHFDSDMLMYQGMNENWIETGISLLERHKDIGAVTPRSGPPNDEGCLYQDHEVFFLDDRGFHSFSSFTSRVYLVDVERFHSLHPVKPLWLGRRDKLRTWWDGKGRALSWESVISNAFQKAGLVRADLVSSDSWSLHPPTKDNTYLDSLPLIIGLVESGRFPPEQGGHYDLNLNYWGDMLAFSG